MSQSDPPKPPADQDLTSSLNEFARARGDEREELPADVGVLRNMVRDEQAKRRKAEAMHEIILGAAREVLEELWIPGGVTPYHPQPSSQIVEAQLLHLSDLQIGKVTEDYNIEVFGERMEQLFKTTVDLCELHRKGRPVNELFISMNGDLVEGEGVFPGQPWVSQVGVFRQAVLGAEILATQIARVSPNYEKIRIVVTGGNHGKGYAMKSFAASSNWDLVLGELVKHQMCGLKNVEVEVVDNWYRVTEVNGVKIMQTHGDVIRSGGDTPFTAIVKRVSRWRDSIPEGFDVLLIGHFHNFAELAWNGAKVFMNGSPESSNDFAQSYMGMASEPMQTVMFLHPNLKVTARYPVYLDRKESYAA